VSIYCLDCFVYVQKLERESYAVMCHARNWLLCTGNNDKMEIDAYYVFQKRFRVQKRRTFEPLENFK